MTNVRNIFEESLSSFKHLWRVDESDWVAQRKCDWNIIANSYMQGTPKAELDLKKRYFLEGNYGGYIAEPTRYFLTPYTTPTEARAVFESAIYGQGTRRQIISGYLSWLKLGVCELSWHRSHLQLFVEGVLGHEYQVVQEDRGGGTMIKISPDPSFWSRGWLGRSSLILEQGKYDGCMEAVDYFISCLAAADDPENRSVSHYNRLFDQARAVLTNPQAKNFAKEFAQNIFAREADIRAAWAVHSHLDQPVVEEPEIIETDVETQQTEEDVAPKTINIFEFDGRLIIPLPANLMTSSENVNNDVDAQLALLLAVTAQAGLALNEDDFSLDCDVTVCVTQDCLVICYQGNEWLNLIMKILHQWKNLACYGSYVDGYGASMYHATNLDGTLFSCSFDPEADEEDDEGEENDAAYDKNLQNLSRWQQLVPVDIQKKFPGFADFDPEGMIF